MTHVNGVHASLPQIPAKRPNPYFNLQNGWLRQLASNAQLSSADIATGVVLCLHMNRKTRQAWPSIDTLAAKTGRNASTTWRCIKRLEREGHISVVRGRGRHTPNRYSFPLKGCADAEFSKTASVQSFPNFKDCVAAISKTASVQREPMREPMIERPARRIKGQKTGIPDGFSLTPDMAEYAAKKIPGMAPPATQDLFERFCNHHTAHGSKFASWPAAWRKWVCNEIIFSRGRTPPPRIVPRI